MEERGKYVPFGISCHRNVYHRLIGHRNRCHRIIIQKAIEKTEEDMNHEY